MESVSRSVSQSGCVAESNQPVCLSVCLSDRSVESVSLSISLPISLTVECGVSLPVCHWVGPAGIGREGSPVSPGWSGPRPHPSAPLLSAPLARCLGPCARQGRGRGRGRGVFDGSVLPAAGAAPGPAGPPARPEPPRGHQLQLQLGALRLPQPPAALAETWSYFL